MNKRSNRFPGFAPSAIVCILLFIQGYAAICQEPPRIGLTLSGGGAKGLAHIGILEAIDSAGLKIDYITGTSMGSIIGSLYAAGYTGKEIEAIARSIDWGVLFSGKPSIGHVNIDEKEDVEKYAVEVPFEDGKFKIFSGIIEGQEIWLKFQELFLPIYDTKEFSKLSIPFKCIATDISTGEAVVLQDGELVTAIRSSMAIPSVFTPVDYKDTKLVDGGVVRNFPVKDVKAMGADYVIGVNLSQGLLQAKDLNSAIDILYQIGFYKNADDFREEKSLCDVLIEPDLKAFHAASFASADSILYIGKAAGHRYYPVFKKLADSLRRLYPDYKVTPKRLPAIKQIIVDDIRITGLKHTTRTSFTHRLKLEKGQWYNGVDVANAIRRVYGSQNYKRIAYHWEPTSPGHANLVFDVVESPLTFVKAGIHYHTFSNVALIAGITSKNLIFDRSKSTVKVNVSENFRILAEHNQTFGKFDDLNLIVSAYHERFRFPIYDDFEQTHLYRSRYSNFDVKLQHRFQFHSAVGIGTSLEHLKIKPKISADVGIEASNAYFNSYVYYHYNTLNKRHFTTQGWNISAEAGLIYHQRPGGSYFTFDTVQYGVDTLSLRSYEQFRLKAEHFKALSPRLTLLTQFNTAVNFDNHNSYMNFYNVGGINDFLRNQVPFTGLNEYELNTNSIGVMMVGFQYKLLKSLYATARINGAIYDFIKTGRKALNHNNFLSGYGLTVGYDSGIGPISLSVMYSDQAQKVSGYVNIGFHF